MIYYEVNDKTFSNQLLALHESFTSNKKVTLYFNDHEYDKMNWGDEPVESFELLMDLHAHRIRDKYKYIILNWSGGTDSHTIYNVFKRNAIHINEIRVKYSPSASEYFPEAHVDWIKKNHWDPLTKISVLNDGDSAHRKLFLDNEDWIFKDVGRFPRFGFTGVDPSDSIEISQRMSDNEWAIIAGYEKPRVYFYNGRWYASMPDWSLKPIMGVKNVESFFLEPKIHLKQCHMLKNFLKTLPNWTNGNRLEYYVEAKAVGRHDELTYGVSRGQKDKNAKNRSDSLIDLNTRLDNVKMNDAFLADRLKDKDVFALMYLKGLYNVRYETAFWQYLNDNWFMQKNALLSMRAIWSKPYDIGL